MLPGTLHPQRYHDGHPILLLWIAAQGRSPSCISLIQGTRPLVTDVSNLKTLHLSRIQLPEL